MSRYKSFRNRTALNQKARRRTIRFRMLRQRMKLKPEHRSQFVYSQMRLNQRTRRRMSLFRMRQQPS